ncbi:MAG: hypothetical protein DRO16_05555 [Thermoprotei archaeon]|nr:MAG: hypothetical protein DRO16_05555 [Thermoprotei archaeon]
MDKVSYALIGVTIYLSITLAIGIWSSRRVKKLVDYVVAGRKLGYLLTYGTILATWFGTGVVIGGASMAYSFGYRGVIMDPIGAGLCIILFGLFIASILRKRGYLTVSDFFRERYGEGMELITAIVQVIAYMGWTASLLLSFGAIFNVFLGLPYSTGLIIGTVVTIIYTMLGGMWSVALTDLIQSFLLIIGVIILLPYVVSAAGGLSVIGKQIPLSDFSILPEKGWGYLGYTGLLGAAFYISSWIVQGLGSLSCQDLVQRALSARNERISKISSIMAGITYIILGLVPATIGIFGRLIIPDLDNPDQIIPMLGLKLLPVIPFTIFSIGLLAALMSSADSAMLIPPTMIVNNILSKTKPELSDKQKLVIGRILVPVTAVTALIIAMYAKTIYFLMNFSWELILMVQGIPFLIGLYWDKPGRKAAYASIIVNLLAWIALIIYTLPLTLDVEEGVLEWAIWDSIYISAPPALILGTIAFILVGLWDKKTNQL